MFLVKWYKYHSQRPYLGKVASYLVRCSVCLDVVAFSRISLSARARLNAVMILSVSSI